jgi:anti-sigma B factor antagonist
MAAQVGGKERPEETNVTRALIFSYQENVDMKISQKQRDSVIILELSGKIMGGPDATTLNDKLHSLIEAGSTKVVADLSKVNWMNSSGLGILISALTTIRNAGGDLKLAAVTERIQSLLMITKLLTIFDTFETVEEAVISFSS